MKRIAEYQAAVSPAVVSWGVPRKTHPTRLDSFLRHCLPHLSLRELRQAIGDGSFSINGLPGRKGDRLFGGESISYSGCGRFLAQNPLPDWHLQVPIHYEDPYLIVLDKPAKMATHGTSGSRRGTIANFLMAHRPSLRAVGKSRWEPGILHRLDQGTSGLLLVAKDQSTFENVRGQFRRGTVRKKYRALVWGKAEDWGEISYPLTHDLLDRRKMKVGEGKKRRGKKKERLWQASTKFRRVGFAKGYSLLDVEIETGVTHQIRVHLKARGYPIVGDPLYAADRREPFGLGRHFLHAYHIGIRHPWTNESVDFECSLPQDLRRVLQRLRIHL